MKQKTFAALSLFLVLALVLTACTGGGGTGTAAGTTTTVKASGTVAASTTTTAKAVSTTTIGATTLSLANPPTQITMFMVTAGQNLPDGWEPNNNWAINRIKELANVEITEMQLPAYSDMYTKFNLMMAGGSLPDYIQFPIRNDMRRYATEGAFADITDIFAESAILSEKYDDVKLKAMDFPDGRRYVLDTLPISNDYSALFLRTDLLDKAGYEGMPETLDDYVDAMRAVKAWDPKSVVYTTLGLSYHEWFLTQPFNTSVCGFDWKPELDKYVNQWEGDNILRSAEFSKMLYDEGLLDQEFITNNAETTNQKRLRDNCLIWAQNRGGIVARLDSLSSDGQNDCRLVPVPMPIADGVGIDAYRTAPSAYGGDCVAFSAKVNQEKFDACVRFVETLFSDEVYELFVFGREGIDFSRGADGTPTPILPSAKENFWRSVYGYAYTYNTVERMNYNSITGIYSFNIPEAEKTAWAKTFMDNINYIQENYLCTLPYSPVEFIPTRPDDIINAVNECSNLQGTLLAKAIVGEINLEEFATQKEELVLRYKSVTDWYNEQIDLVRGTY